MAITAIIVACLAIYGVKYEWKKQLKAKANYEIARRYLKTALQLRDAIKFFRCPFIPAEELNCALLEIGCTQKDIFDDKKNNRAVYAKRWNQIVEAKTNMEAELYDAEITLGIEAKNVQKDLNNLFHELYFALQRFLHDSSKLDEKTENMIYNFGDEDEFSIKVEKAITSIEEFLKPYYKFEKR